MNQHPLAASEISSLIDQQVSQIEMPAEPAGLYDPIRYILRLGGKRLRPLLALMSYNLFQESVAEAVLPALSIEVFHNFTLVHDDIMDKAPIRRGEATVHKKWNDNIAILSGDAMLVKAYELLTKARTDKLPELLAAFNKTALEVCEGQQLDMDFETRSFDEQPVTEAEYLQMIRLKTAVLFGFSLQFGGITGTEDGTIAQLLYDAGVHLGLAFQLQDDLLDVFGDEKFGKQPGGDIINGKKTYLLVKVLALAHHTDKAEIINTINNRQLPGDEKVAKIKHFYNRYNLQEITRKEIQSHLQNFNNTLDSISSERAVAIKTLIDTLANRAV